MTVFHHHPAWGVLHLHDCERGYVGNGYVGATKAGRLQVRVHLWELECAPVRVFASDPRASTTCTRHTDLALRRCACSPDSPSRQPGPGTTFRLPERESAVRACRPLAQRQARPSLRPSVLPHHVAPRCRVEVARQVEGRPTESNALPHHERVLRQRTLARPSTLCCVLLHVPS